MSVRTIKKAQQGFGLNTNFRTLSSTYISVSTFTFTSRKLVKLACSSDFVMHIDIHTRFFSVHLDYVDSKRLLMKLVFLGYNFSILFSGLLGSSAAYLV